MSLSFGKLFLVVLTLSIAGWSEAGIVSRDLYEPGDGLLTYDDVNHREWLDFSESVKYSPEGLLEAISTGGALEGFQFALEEEVVSLLDAENILLQNSFDFSKESPSELLELLGAVITYRGDVLGNSFLSYGFVAKLQGSSGSDYYFDGTTIYLSSIGNESISTINRPIEPRQMGVIAVISSTPVELPIENTLLGVGTPLLGPYDNPATTFWMYREVATVPEPTTLSCSLVACLALSAYSARSKTP